MKIFKRIASSVAAIASVCVIFGAKAMEAERRAGDTQVAMSADKTPPSTGKSADLH